jgi:hypothetical protein
VAMMIPLAAIALAASPPQPQHASAVAQATATIRILSAVRLKLDAPRNEGAPPARDAILRSSDGTTKAAKLIEFQ